MEHLLICEWLHQKIKNLTAVNPSMEDCATPVKPLIVQEDIY